MPEPVVGCDLDGTLGGHHEWFWQFAQLWSGRELPHPDNYDGTQAFWQFLGFSKSTYRRIKLAYRQGGMKRSMPAFPYAREFTVEVRKAGAKLVMCTTRPYLSLDNIDQDTRHWFRRNRLQYDNVISGEHKYRELARQYGKENVVCVLEDLPEMVQQATDLGLFTLLMDRPYNRPPVLSGPQWSGERVECLEEAAAAIVVDLMKTWKEQHQ